MEQEELLQEKQMVTVYYSISSDNYRHNNKNTEYAFGFHKIYTMYWKDKKRIKILIYENYKLVHYVLR